MRSVRALDPAVAPWGAAVLAAAWAAAFLVGDQPRALVAVPLVLVGVGLVGRRPLAAATLVTAAAVASAVLGAGYGNVDLVPAAALTLFAAGRYVAALWPGALVTAVFAVASAARGELAVGSLAATGVVFGSAWVFGRVVRHRAVAARAAAREAAVLAAADPRAWSEQQALEERRRMAGRALHTLRTAVLDMQAAARAGAISLSSDAVGRIRQRGIVAIDELRELIGLLHDPLPTPAAAEVPRRSVWRGDLGVALVAVAGTLCLLAVDPGWLGGGLVLAYLGTAASLAVRRTRPAVGCLVAAVALLPVIVDPPDVPDSLLPLVPAYLVLTWAVVEHGRRHEGWGLVVLVVAAGGAASRHGATGMGFIACVFAFASLVAVAWGERDRILQQAQERSTAIRCQLTMASAAAVSAERLRLARDLHDVTSHAVGVMVLQAGAAEAMRLTDAPQAREALLTVEAAGEQALEDIAALFAALEDGPAPSPDALRAGIARLIGGLRGAGMEIAADIDALPDSAAAGTVVYRVVQEGLTNAARHAPGAPVRVEARREGRGYVVRVSDAGGDGPSPISAGGGFGLPGLRERVEACAGTLRAGPDGRGGFVLEARWPAFNGADAPSR